MLQSGSAAPRAWIPLSPGPDSPDSPRSVWTVSMSPHTYQLRPPSQRLSKHLTCLLLAVQSLQSPTD